MSEIQRSLNNIRTIQRSIDETPIREIAEEVTKVARLFLSYAKTSHSSFEHYVRDFLRLVDIIRIITKNCLFLDSQINFSDKPLSFEGLMQAELNAVLGKGLDLQILRNSITEVMDRIFELNLLSEDLAKYHRELTRFLKRYQQFYKRTSKAKAYVRVIKQEKKVQRTLQLFRLTVTTGLKSLRTGIHPEHLLEKNMSAANRKRLLENSQYNYRRVTHSVIRYFQAVCTILVPNVRPILRQAEEVIIHLSKDGTRDDSYMFILDTLKAYNQGLKNVVQSQMTDPLLPEFRVSHDNLCVIGLGQLDIPSYQEEEWIGLEDKKIVPRTKKEQQQRLRVIKTKMTELNRLAAKGRLGIKTLSEAKKKILYQNFFLSTDYVTILKRLCKNLMEPIEYDHLIDSIRHARPNVVEIPDVLMALGELSNNIKGDLTAGNHKRRVRLRQEVTDRGYQHRIGNGIYENTTPQKLETFVLVFCHFYYAMQMLNEGF
jgi:hypothetical protein